MKPAPNACPNCSSSIDLSVHKSEWTRTVYCCNCGFYEEHKFDSPQPITKQFLRKVRPKRA